MSDFEEERKKRLKGENGSQIKAQWVGLGVMLVIIIFGMILFINQ